MPYVEKNETITLSWSETENGYADRNINQGLIVTMTSPIIANGSGAATNYTIGSQVKAISNIIKRILNNEDTEDQNIYEKYYDNNTIVYASCSLFATGLKDGKLT